jgi:hypothetical protein
VTRARGENILRQPVVLLARVLGYIDVWSLNPDGKLYFPDLVRELVERYQFQKFPEKLEEFEFAKGVEFLGGKHGNQPIQKFAIWDSLMVVETLSGTDESKAVLEEILAWASEKFKLLYKPGQLKRFGYVSDVTFFSDSPILEINPAAARLATQTSKELSEIWQEPFLYRPIILRFGHDPLSRKYAIAQFTIERRGEVKFSENKYFSEAPLPTKTHLRMLAQFEQEMALTGKASTV